MESKSKYIKAVESCIKKHDPKLPAAHRNSIAAYIGTKHGMLGIGTALQKQLAKQGYDCGANLQQHLDVFDHLFKTSPVFELKTTSLLMVDHHYKKTDKKDLYRTMIGWVDHVDNWAHSDYLSKFYTRFLEDKELKDDFVKKLNTWNRDKNPWKRRQSMVALLYYARTKKEYLSFATITGFVKPLLDDEDYFVQKGLGWTLRECYNVYPRETFAFADQHHERISSTAFSAACEKMTVKEKESLKKKRKAARAERKAN